MGGSDGSIRRKWLSVPTSPLGSASRRVETIAPPAIFDRMREEIDITPGHSEAIVAITQRPKTAEQFLGDTSGEVRDCSEILVTGS